MQNGLSKYNKFLKRTFDVLCSFIGIVLTFWIVMIVYLIILLMYKESGFYKQERVGLNGKIFTIIKLRSMKMIEGFDTTVTIKNDPRITPIGKFIRKTKIDELPQLINVLRGEMSFVGPRPDVLEVINSLSESEKKVYLSVRPGITGPATLKYRNEEELLSTVKNPEVYSLNIIFRDKYYINENYIENYSFLKDIKYIFQTVCGKKSNVKIEYDHNIKI